MEMFIVNLKPPFSRVDSLFKSSSGILCSFFVIIKLDLVMEPIKVVDIEIIDIHIL